MGIGNDLMGLFDAPVAANPSAPAVGGNDLLSGVFGGGQPAANPMAGNAMGGGMGTGGGLDDIFGGGPVAPATDIFGGGAPAGDVFGGGAAFGQVQQPPQPAFP